MELESRGVWIVVLNSGGIFGAWVNESIARRAAMSVHGILICLPIAAGNDYRDNTDGTYHADK